MTPTIPSDQLVHDITFSEIDYMVDRMRAIECRTGNPEGIEIHQFGHTWCFYSKTMPWATFYTVKGIKAEDSVYLD